MSGWTIGYGLINFAILAAVIFWIGRKMLPKMLNERRARIEEALKEAEEAKERARGLRGELEDSDARREAQAEEIRRVTEQKAGEKRTLSLEK